MVKIYVDSRNRISGTNEDFVFQIPESIDLPDSQCYVDVVLLPNVFLTIKSGYNDKLRFRESVVTQQGGTATVYAHQVSIASGQYNGITLAEAVQTAMRSVTNVTPSQLVVQYDPTKAKLKITTTAPFDTQFDIFPDGLLTEGTGNWNSVQSLYPVASNSPGETQSAGDVCGFLGNILISASTSIEAFADSVVNVQRHHCCYIHSDLGVPGSSYGPRGESDIIRRIVVDAPQNGLAIDRHTTAHDTVEVGPKNLRSMKFRLAGVDGNTVDLRGHSFSFSIIFHEKM